MALVEAERSLTARMSAQAGMGQDELQPAMEERRDSKIENQKLTAALKLEKEKTAGLEAQMKRWEEDRVVQEEKVRSKAIETAKLQARAVSEARAEADQATERLKAGRQAAMDSSAALAQQRTRDRSNMRRWKVTLRRAIEGLSSNKALPIGLPSSTRSVPLP